MSRIAAIEGQKIIIKYLRDRMKEKRITRDILSKELQVSKVTITRWFKGDSPMPLLMYLHICGILELRPYLIPREFDENKMQRIFFN